MIDVRFSFLQRPAYELKKKLEGLRTFVNDYVFSNIDAALSRIRSNAVRNQIYNKVERKTGSLGRSLQEYKQKINQYTSDFGLFFNPAFSRSIGTNVGYGAALITPKKRKWLTVPWNKSVANSLYYMNGLAGDTKSVQDIPGIKVAMLKGKTPIWYTGKRVKGKYENPVAIGKKAVFVQRRISPYEIHTQLDNEVSKNINRLANKAVAEFMRQ